MRKVTGVFAYELGSEGVRIYSVRDTITDPAITDTEVDAQIALAKADLDAVAKRAKAALKKYLAKPLS